MPQQFEISVCNSFGNFMRRQSQILINDHGYKIALTVDSTLQINTRRIVKNRLIQTKKYPENALDLLLCTEFEQHLVLIEYSKTSNLFKYTLPGFIWFLLENYYIKTHYGSYIWRFIPLLWRYWWIMDAQ